MMIKYTKIDVPSDAFRLSPSGLATFRKNPKEWLDNLNGLTTFKGNKSSVLGTLVHYIFESNFDGRTEDRFYEDCNIYLEEQLEYGAITEEEFSEIVKLLPEYYLRCNSWMANKDVATTLYSEAVVKYQIPTTIETANPYYLAGSIDAIVTMPELDVNELHGTNNVVTGIRDYKTANRKTSSLASYKLQLLTYAYAYQNSKNVPISFIEVILITRTKSKGVEFTPIREFITQKDIDAVKSYYDEIILTHQTALKYPQIENLLFRDGVDFMGRLGLFNK